jgi:GntR family transcriptional regulator/MocR family aminotransferase
MKALYMERRNALRECLGRDLIMQDVSGLAVPIRLPKGFSDVALAEQALSRGIAPLPMSVWHHNREDAQPGFLLGVTNLRKGHLEQACGTLRELIAAGA